MNIKQVDYGFGRHIGCLSTKDVIAEAMIIYIEEIPLIFSTLFSRLSGCLFLLRIFTVNIYWRWTLYSIIALTTATNFASATIVLLQCQPLAKLWDQSVSGTCWTPEARLAVRQYQGGK